MDGHWDGLRRDAELWQEVDDRVDCVVHFHARGSSQRGASLRIPFSIVQTSRSLYLLREVATAFIGAPGGSHDLPGCCSYLHELYLPAPKDLTREQTYAYHVTTRNYFAYLTGKPALVGEKSGTALADLWDRVKEWENGDDSTSRLLRFCEDQGYMQLAGNVQYATAVLNLAERARLRDVWIHAFVHCVGMHNRLARSPYFDSLSSVTQALIIRAALEMDLHIARVVRAVGGFLEEPLGAEHLGLGRAARDHLDRFRSFLHSHYLEHMGFYPPTTTGPFDKKFWLSVYQDFHALYKYLVDNESTGDMAASLKTNAGVYGGVCILQNVQAFNERHNYEALPHPQPVLPKQEPLKRSFKLGRGAKMSPKLALSNATNELEEATMALPIIREYKVFERDHGSAQGVSITEARKVRWLLIYGTLQMVISIIRAPPEVKDVEAASYPLCVLTTGGPPWDDADQESVETMSSVPSTPQRLATLTDESERISIHPDCEAESAQDYFSLSRNGSTLALDKMKPAPLRINVPVSRGLSIRSSVNSSVSALQRSVAGSFSRRNSIRRQSVQASPTSPQMLPLHREILVDGYGNGTFAVDEDSASTDFAASECASPTNHSPSAFAGFDFGLASVPENSSSATSGRGTWDGYTNAAVSSDFSSPEPILEASQLDCAPYPRDSSASVNISSYSSSVTSASSSSSPSDFGSSPRSSIICETAGMEFSAPISLNHDVDRRLSAIHSRHRMSASIGRSDSQFQNIYGISTTCTSLSAGCYVPKGPPSSVSVYRPSGAPTERCTTSPVSRFSIQAPGMKGSVSSDASSDASSEYADDSTQADEIEEEEMRGRRRSRALDGLAKFKFGL